MAIGNTKHHCTRNLLVLTGPHWQTVTHDCCKYAQERKKKPCTDIAILRKGNLILPDCASKSLVNQVIVIWKQFNQRKKSSMERKKKKL